MQTPGQSQLEVGIDFSLSLLVNIGAQILFYGALATAGRSLSVAALVLGLAMPRRYATRRFFNTLLSPGIRQPRWQSWLEVGVDTVLGLFLAIILQWIFYGPAATWAKAGGLTGIVYAITMCRRYILRRLFVMWHPPPGESPAFNRDASLNASYEEQMHDMVASIAAQEFHDTTC
jgi:hypothetical protein